MTPIQIIGQPGAGKTTLTAELISALTTRGLAVGSLKHSAHAHELDKPGKDSYIHRQAGANPAAMVTGKMAAVYFPTGDHATTRQLLKQHFGHTDITLIEGWISGPHAKVEVWRPETDREPLAHTLPLSAGVAALVTDADPGSDCLEPVRERKIPILPRREIDPLLALILGLRKTGPSARIPLGELVLGMSHNLLKRLLAHGKSN
ncbi:MAG: molybdopterin-guanine dinucleotide biosynthesis protein B [Desulfobacterales bacterium]|nr:molybdopterin-guanine dinucleotide biosynthesis protein B [Desulfobacterales bacterium]